MSKSGFESSLLRVFNDLYPFVTGGTEIFVSQLLQFQLRSKSSNLICWPAHAVFASLD